MTTKHPIPDELLIDHIAVLAKTGAGKTYLGKGIVERLLDQGRRVCIVDPKNAWWGLKSSSDGKSPGYPIIVFGGPKADVPLLATHGKILGEAIASGHLSCIICTKGMSESERIRFLTDFFQTLDQKNTQPLHLVLDEAHMMAPQRPLGDMQRLTHYTSELVSGGRGMGFRILLLSQRPARLNKDVLTQCETLVAMRMTGIQDRDAVKSWIHDQADMETGKEIVASLTGLQNGEGWIWAPAKDILKRVKFPLISTYDNSATTKNTGADDRAKLAPVDLAALEQKLGSAKTELDARDPGKLKARIAELEKELAKKPAAAAPAPKINVRADNTRIRSEGYNAGYAAGKKLAERYKAKIAQVWKTYHRILTVNAEWLENVVVKRDLPTILREVALDLPKDLDTNWAEVFGADDAGPPPTDNGHLPAAAVVEHQERAARVFNQGFSAASVAKPTGKPEQRVIDAIAWWQSVGVSQPTRVQVAVRAGYSPDTGNVRNIFSAVVGAGLAQAGNAPGLIVLTSSADLTDDATKGHANPSAHIIGIVKSLLNGPENKVFDQIVAAYPNDITRKEAATAAGYEPDTGNVRNIFSAIAAYRVFTKSGQGRVKAAEWLFPVAP